MATNPLNTGYKNLAGVDLIEIYDSDNKGTVTTNTVTTYKSNLGTYAGKDLGSIFTLYNYLAAAGLQGTAGINSLYKDAAGIDIGSLFVTKGTISGGAVTVVTSTGTTVISGFTPEVTWDLGLALWLDANDITTITKDVNNNVSTWIDKSGYKRDAVKFGNALNNTGTITYSSTGFNNMPTVNFSVGNNGFGLQSPVPAGTFASGVTIFIVLKKTGLAQSSEVLLSRCVAPWNPSPFDIYGTGRLIGNGGSATVFSAAPNISDTTANSIYSITISSTLYDEYINGSSSFKKSQALVYGDANATFVCIGQRINNDIHYNGVISEILMYNTVLTDNNRQKIEGYLAWKWGFQSSLVAGHPYLSAKPLYLVTTDNILGGMTTSNVTNNATYIVTGRSDNSLNGTYTFSQSSYYSTGYAGWKAFTGILTGDTCWHCGMPGVVAPYNYVQLPYDNISPISSYIGGNTSSATGTPYYYTTTMSGTVYAGEWFQINFPYSFVLTDYTIKLRSMYPTWTARGPATWYIGGSNDGVTWDMVHSNNYTTTAQAPTQAFASYTFTNTIKYSYYRMVVNKVFAINVCHIGAWILTVPPPTSTPNLYFPFNGYIDNYGSNTGVGSIVGGGATCLVQTAVSKFGLGCFQNTTGLTASYFSLPSIPANQNGYTFSFWINLTATTAGMVWTFQQSASINNRIFCFYNNNNIILSINGIQTTIFTPTLSTWYHIVWKVTKTSVNNVYVSTAGGTLGNIINTTITQTYTSAAYDSNRLLGDPFPTNNVGAKGYVDEFYYYDAVLNSTQINNLYTINALETPVVTNTSTIDSLIPGLIPWGIYDASLWDSSTNVLPEARGITAKKVTSTGTITKATASGNGAVSIPNISGGTTSTLTWPIGSIPTTFTICAITRYTNASGNQQRILTSVSTNAEAVANSKNWFLGHNNVNSATSSITGNKGVAYFGNVNANDTSISLTNTSWVSTCGKNNLTGTAANNVLANGSTVGKTLGGLGGYTLGINTYGGLQLSDWAFTYVIIYDSALTDEQMATVSQKLMYYLATGTMIQQDTLLYKYNFNSGDINGLNKLANYASGAAVYDAIVTGATVNTSILKFGSGSLYLNGVSQYITIPTFTSNLNGISIAYWIYNTPATGASGWERVLDFTDGPNSNDVVIPTTQQFFVRHNTGTTYTLGNALNIAASTWQHIVWTMECTDTTTFLGTWKLYSNGTLLQTYTNSRYPLPLTRINNFLGKSSTNDSFIKGYLDEFRYYKSVLSVDDVSNIYKSSSLMVFNSNFSTPAITLNSYSSVKPTSWNISSYMILVNGSNQYFPAVCPTGYTQYVCIQQAVIGSKTLSQSLTLTQGTYKLSFYAAPRGFNVNGSFYTKTCSMSVSIGSQVIVSNFQFPTATTTASNVFSLFNYSFTIATTGTYDLTFTVSNSAANDSAINITGIKIDTDSLLFHYKFNSGDINGSNMLANYASGTAVYDATVVGTTAATIDTTNGKFGSGCLYLSAKTGYILIPSFTTDLNGYSISLWCKGTQLSTILHLTNNTDVINLIAMNNTAFYVFSPTAVMSNSTAFAINDNIWNHMVFTVEYTNTSTYLYGNWKIYKNGVLASSNINNNYPPFLTRTTNYLGKHLSDNTNNSIGYFDEFRMYKRVLSPLEVSNLYNVNTTDDTGLLASIPLGAVGLYACKWVNNNYKGPILQLRITLVSIDYIQDFFMNSTGTFIGTALGGSGTSLANWVTSYGGTFGTTVVYVAKWYDQSPTSSTASGSNAFQNTVGSQPKFDYTSKAIDFSIPTDAFFNLPDGTIPYNDSSYTVIMQHDTVTLAGTNISGFCGSGTTSNNQSNSFGTVSYGGGRGYYNFWYAADIIAGNSATGANKPISFVYGNAAARTAGFTPPNSSNTFVYESNISQPFISAIARSARTSTSLNNFIGKTNLANSPLNAKMNFLYFFNTNLNDTDRVLMENAFDNRGLLTTIPAGSVGLYACKWVNDNYKGPMLQLRITPASVTYTEDFYMNSTGIYIGTTLGGRGTTLQQWVVANGGTYGTTVVYVAKWYDQSITGSSTTLTGQNHATQNTAANQPVLTIDVATTGWSLNFSTAAYLNVSNTMIPNGNTNLTVTARIDNVSQILANPYGNIIVLGTQTNNLGFGITTEKVTATTAKFTFSFMGPSVVSGSIAITNNMVLTGKYNGASLSSYYTLFGSATVAVSPVAKTSFNFTQSLVNTIGVPTGSNNFGTLKNLCIYTTALSDIDRVTIEGI